MAEHNPISFDAASGRMVVGKLVVTGEADAPDSDAAKDQQIADLQDRIAMLECEMERLGTRVRHLEEMLRRAQAPRIRP